MKLILKLTTSDNSRIMEKIIYCDPTEKQLDNFILALLNSINILSK